MDAAQILVVEDEMSTKRKALKAAQRKGVEAEAAGIEPEGTRSKHNAEPAHNRAKPEQNQALRIAISPAEHQPEGTSLHFRDTNETHPNTQKLYGTTKPAQQPMSNDLAAVVAAWPSLSDDQKAKVLAIIGG